MTRIVSIGECMVEMSPTDAPGAYRMAFAGDTMNTAWYMRRLLRPNDRVAYMSAVGDDRVSDQMIAFLSASGIDTAHVARRTDRTIGLYLIQLEDGERSFSYWRGQSAARTLAQDAEALNEALHGADMAYFSGITVAILPAEDRLRLLDALARFRAAGGMVVFDPNLRPRLWDSPDRMTQAIMAAAAVSDIALPSFEDEHVWFNDADPEATARRYAGQGAQTVIVKNGPGDILSFAGGVPDRHPPVPASRIVDTTAAGDSFNAGFLAARIRGRTLGDAINAGAALAAQVIQVRGALVVRIEGTEAD